MTRRLIVLLFALIPALPTRADLLPAQPAGRTTQVASAGITPGTYLGQWSDGRELRNTLRVISPDMITLQRQGYSTAPLPYHRIGPTRFQSGTGNNLTVLGPARLRWTNAAGISVIYVLD